MVVEGLRSSLDDRNTSTPSTGVRSMSLDAKGSFSNHDLECKNRPLVINEGRLPPRLNVVSVLGKGKEAMSPTPPSSLTKNMFSGAAFNPDASSSIGFKSKESPLVQGKGNVSAESLEENESAILSSPSKKFSTEMANDLEASSSVGFNLKVSRFSNFTVAENEAEKQDLLNLNSNDKGMNVDEELQMGKESKVVPNIDNREFGLVNDWFKTK
ncbi:hypothetical protein MA16_Dca008706 [Dendrobium catenatum]|uniref:Uncharacterized protein n=1 Tax=Dendrobium catenatum TaxID=906689 RepID=A0A2I0W4K1_9ASPA|nr:hypothetical protein MA16_Dca008706 [Dendrobium catenatum]